MNRNIGNYLQHQSSKNIEITISQEPSLGDLLKRESMKLNIK
jgi:hypothetical protein